MESFFCFLFLKLYLNLFLPQSVCLTSQQMAKPSKNYADQTASLPSSLAFGNESSISSSRLCTQARKAIRPHLISGRSLMGCQGNRRQFNWASVNALAGCDQHRQTMTVE